jgi:hypothetical protein
VRVEKGAKDPDDCRRKYERPDPGSGCADKKAAVEDSGIALGCVTKDKPLRLCSLDKEPVVGRDVGEVAGLGYECAVVVEGGGQ